MDISKLSEFEAVFIKRLIKSGFKESNLASLVDGNEALNVEAGALKSALWAVFESAGEKGLKMVRRSAVVSQLPDMKLPMPVTDFCERMNSCGDLWSVMFDRAPDMAVFQLEPPEQ